MKVKPIIGYSCKKCGTSIPGNTRGVFTRCNCSAIAVDGDQFITRIFGNKKFVAPVRGQEEEIVYRIKELSSGKFFSPRKGYTPGHFSLLGKFYSRKPSLTWVPSGTGECVIESYRIVKI
jgi:hypothetical protein